MSEQISARRRREKGRRNLTASLLCTTLLLLGCPLDGEPAAGSELFVIVQPGYPGSTRDAAGFVGELAGYLEASGAGKLKGIYYNLARPALEALADGQGKRVVFGLVSVGFYLEYRKRFGMQAVLQSKPADNYVVVARSGDVSGPEALKGLAVSGGPLHEPRFLQNIVFAAAGRGEGARSRSVDVESWDLKPTLRVSRAVRHLVRGEKHRAVVLTGRDYQALSQLYPAKTLEKVVESDYYPPAFLVAFGNPEEAGSLKLSEEKLRKVKEALLGLSRSPEGRGILDVMGAKGFEGIQVDWLKKLEGRYDAGKREGNR